MPAALHRSRRLAGGHDREAARSETHHRPARAAKLAAPPAGSSTDYICNQSPQVRQNLALKPGIAAHPHCAAPTRMRKREVTRQCGPETAHVLGHRTLRPGGQIACLGILADQDRQANTAKRFDDPRVPERRALGARRQISGVARSRKAQSHRHQGDQGRGSGDLGFGR